MVHRLHFNELPENRKESSAKAKEGFHAQNPPLHVLPSLGSQSLFSISNPITRLQGIHDSESCVEVLIPTPFESHHYSRSSILLLTLISFTLKFWAFLSVSLLIYNALTTFQQILHRNLLWLHVYIAKYQVWSFSMAWWRYPSFAARSGLQNPYWWYSSTPRSCLWATWYFFYLVCSSTMFWLHCWSNFD